MDEADSGKTPQQVQGPVPKLSHPFLFGLPRTFHLADDQLAVAPNLKANLLG